MILILPSSTGILLNIWKFLCYEILLRNFYRNNSMPNKAMQFNFSSCHQLRKLFFQIHGSLHIIIILSLLTMPKNLFFTQSLTSCIQTYSPPNVPRDFVPLHKFPNCCNMPENQSSWQKPLTSTERSQLLSDQPGKD